MVEQQQAEGRAVGQEIVAQPLLARRDGGAVPDQSTQRADRGVLGVDGRDEVSGASADPRRLTEGLEEGQPSGVPARLREGCEVVHSASLTRARALARRWRMDRSWRWPLR